MNECLLAVNEKVKQMINARKRPRDAAVVVAVTGSSCSGKTTLVNMLRDRLQQRGLDTGIVEQDRFRRTDVHACEKVLPEGTEHAGKITWEGPQFTNWEKFHEQLVASCSIHRVVLIEGYLLLDALHCQLPHFCKLFDAILWIRSTKQQVILRRKEWPNRGTMPLKWTSATQYAEHCVWPTHEAYEARVAADGLLTTHPRAAFLSADDTKHDRLQQAYGHVCRWFPELCTAGTSSSLPRCTTLAASLDRSRPVVLVTHGSMNPVHLGHVQMMVRAKELIEAEGFHVLGGVIGITNAEHIRRKLQDGEQALAAEEPMPDATRLQLLELACKHHQGWLKHCGGRGTQVSSEWRLANLLKSEWPENALVASVQGSDVFGRYPPRNKEFKQDGLLVIAARQGDEEASKLRRDDLRIGSDKVLILPPDPSLAAASSTLVRSAAVRKDRAAVVRMCGEAVADAMLSASV